METKIAPSPFRPLADETAQQFLERLKNSAPMGLPRTVKIRHIEPGLVFYEHLDHGKGATVLVKKETLDAMQLTLVNCPIVNRAHRDMLPSDFKLGNADGIITRAWYEPFDGWYWIEAVVWDERTLKNIEDGYGASCQYSVTAWGEAGTHHNVPYAREVLGGVYNHVAIVDNPRYEGAKILMNSKGGSTMKLKFWKKDTENTAANSVEVETEKTVLSVDGKDVPLDEAVKAYNEKIEAEALANAVPQLTDEDLVAVGEGKVSVKDLKAAYAEKLKNAAAGQVKTDHKDGKHAEKAVENCDICNAAAEEKARNAKEAEELESFNKLKAAADKRNEPLEIQVPQSRRERAAVGREMFGSGKPA